MDREELIAFLKDNLSIVIEHKEIYNGGMNGGSMYDSCRTIKLMLSGEVISEEDLEQ